MTSGGEMCRDLLVDLVHMLFFVGFSSLLEGHS